jgi:ribosomal protein L35
MRLTQVPLFRFFPVANGKFKRWQVGKRHINVGFSPERTNRLMGSLIVEKKSDQRMLRKALPYAH